jgi:predicted dithiol-disulfide oxidoreductase (DUF899 family)
VSSTENAFNYDFRVSFTPEQVASGHIDYNFGEWDETGEEWPGISAFYKDEKGDVFHTYSTFGRGVEVMMGTYAMLDLCPWVATKLKVWTGCVATTSTRSPPDNAHSPKPFQSARLPLVGHSPK